MDALEADLPPVPRIRRLSLVGARDPPQQVVEEVDLTVADSPSESSATSTVGAEEVVVLESQIPHNPHQHFELNRRALNFGLASLDEVELHIVFRSGAVVMKNVPFCMKGGEVLGGHDSGDELRAERGWKMLMLLPRMLLARPPRGGRISPRKLQTRINMFSAGEWRVLMEVSNEYARAGAQAKGRFSRRSAHDHMESRVHRAESLVQLASYQQVGRRWTAHQS